MKLEGNTINKFFYTHTGYVSCPFCGRLTYYSLKQNEQNNLEAECKYCDKEFKFTAE